MIVVFGAAGFIGTYLVDQLVASGKDVVASDISTVGEAYYRGKSARFEHIDITQRSDFDRLPSGEIEAVVHLACVQPANVSEAKYDAADFIRVNVLGTLNILEFCRSRAIPKIIYTCSHRNTQGMWDAKNGSPIREDEGRAIKFTGDYAMFSISESAATDCAEHYARAHGLEVVVFRLPPVYGYGPHSEIFKDGKAIKTGFQIFIDNAEQGLPIELWGDVENGRDIVYVKDVVDAIERALARPGVGGLYNISSGRKLTLREQAEAVLRVFSPAEKRSEIRHVPEKPNFIENYVYDISEAKRILGWHPAYSFDEMLLDYRREQKSGRFAYLLEKRRTLMQGS